jgi:hypothetical protein
MLKDKKNQSKILVKIKNIAIKKKIRIKPDRKNG